MKQQLLQQYFGHNSFRPGQEELIDAVQNGRDVLGIMPTGTGKSVCFQIPAMMLPGITLVISPLIALMKDQVMSLVQAGIPGAYLNSSLTPGQMRTAMKRAYEGRYKIIYLAPERLSTEDFLAFAHSRDISLIAIDEAHCVSQWGQDFRPSYLRIHEFIDSLPRRPVLAAFTATATAQTQRDIIELLDLQQPHIAVTGFDRPNLTYIVRKPQDKLVALQQYLNQHRGQCGIIYCLTRGLVVEVWDDLRRRGFATSLYHGGLSNDERRANQESFQSGESSIMVATNAFGLGINKPDIRFVLHYNMPKDIESYYQEAGRAGRDGLASECALFYEAKDIRINTFLIKKSLQHRLDLDDAVRTQLERQAQERLKRMTAYVHTLGCLRHFLLAYFGEKSRWFCGHCSHCCPTLW